MFRRLISASLVQTRLFSTSSQLEKTLRSIPITPVEGQKPTNVWQSGVVVDHHIDPQLKKVSLSLNLTRDYRQIKATLMQNLQDAGFAEIDITLAPKTQKDKYVRKGNLLAIKKVIAVSSCKGGVGKSTVAVNLAATLSLMGSKVGIFDSDIYGPSLPTLINKEGESLSPAQDNPSEIQPLVYEGIKCMSFGFVANKPAVMRGPMVSSIVSKLLHQTRWGELDYLVVDMPPGTGDIQLTLCQELKFDGAVIVTTPQRLAFMDVMKGIEMFQDLRVRIFGVVENMAYYQCGKCGTPDYIFGKGYTKLIMEQFGIENAIQIPLMSDISKYSDAGAPLTLVMPQSHPISSIYRQLGANVIKEAQTELAKVMVYYNTNTRQIIAEGDGKKKKINSLHLRSKCRCAGCVDELSQALIIKKEELDPEVYPTRIQEKGNYAVAVVWSDGHRSSIYPYKRLFSDEI